MNKEASDEIIQDLVFEKKNKDHYLIQVNSRELFKLMLKYIQEELELEVSEPSENFQENEVRAFFDNQGKIWFKGSYTSHYEDNKESIVNFVRSQDINKIKRIDDQFKEDSPRDKKIIEEQKKISKDVAVKIASKLEDQASEDCVVFIKKYNFIYTTRNDLKSEIWFYERGIYVPNGKTKIQEIVRNILGTLYTPQRANRVIAKIEADTYIDEDDFFKNNYVDEIPVLNGILNLKTKVLGTFTPNKIFFNKLPVRYDSEASCPHVDKFLSDILKSPEDKIVIYELMGYSLIKDHFIEKAVMLVGDGRNGKGKLLSLFKHFLGIENCCSVALSQMNHSSTGICELFGKLVNIAGDLSNTALKDTGLFKEITGRDLISAKRKFLTDLTFENYSKQIFACNELPRVYDMSLGFWSRWVLFEFPFTFVSEDEFDKAKDKSKLKIRDEQIIKKLITSEELSGLLNRALKGLDSILHKGDFSNTKGTQEVKEFWIRKADSFNAFCMDCIEEDNESYITKKDLRSSFHKYVKSHKLKSVSDKVIKINLEDNFGVIEERKTVAGESFIPCWVGIKWKSKKTDCEGCDGFSESIGNLNSSTFTETLSTLSINKKTFNLNDILPKFDSDIEKCMVWVNDSLEKGKIVEIKPGQYVEVI